METMKGLKKATNIVAAGTLLLILALASACSRPLDIEKLSKLPPPTYEQALALAKKVSFTYWTHIPGAWDPLMVHLFMPEEKYYAATVEDLQRWAVAREVVGYYQRKRWNPLAMAPYRVVIRKQLRGEYVGDIRLCRELSCKEYLRLFVKSWLVPGRVEARVGRAGFWREMNRLNRKFFDRVARFLVKYPEVYHLLNGDLFKDRLDDPPGRFKGPGGRFQYFENQKAYSPLLSSFSDFLIVYSDGNPWGSWLVSRYFLGVQGRCFGFFTIKDLERKGVTFLHSDAAFDYKDIKADDFSGFYVFYIQPPSLPVHLYGQFWWEASPKVKAKVYKEYGSGEGSLQLAWLKTKPEDRVFWEMVHPYTIYAAFKPSPNGPVPRSAEEAKRVGDEIFWYDRTVNLKDVEEIFDFQIKGDCRKWHDFKKWGEIVLKYLYRDPPDPFTAEKKFKESVAFGDPIKTRLCERRARLIRDFVVSSRGRRCCPSLYRKYLVRKRLRSEEKQWIVQIEKEYGEEINKIAARIPSVMVRQNFLGIKRMEWWYPELWGKEGRTKYKAALRCIQEEKDWVLRERRLREELRREGGDVPVPERLKGMWQEMWGKPKKKNE